MSKEMFEVWSANRTIKKAFLCEPVLTAVIAKANFLGINGRILVLEKSGSEISDDETLEYLAKKSSIFILLTETLQWTPHNWQTPISVTSDISLQKEQIELPVPANQLRLRSTSKTINTQSILNSQSNSDIEPPSAPHSPILEPLRISPELSSSSKRNSSLQLFSNFTIPWNSLPDDVLDKLRNKKWLGNRIHAFIKEVVKDLRRASFYIPAKIYRCIAESIVEKFPDSFLNDVNRNESSASEMLLVMMRNHNNYLNSAASKEGSARARTKKRKRGYTHRKNAKKRAPSDDDQEDMTKKMQRSLKNSYPKNKLMTQAREKIVSSMEECFTAQRSYLNKPGSCPSIEDIQKDWPYLLNKECILRHFVQLTEVSYTKICDGFQAEKQKLRDYFAKQSDIKGLETDDFALLLALSEYFEEDLTYVIQKFTMGTAVEDIPIHVAGPWIAVIQETTFDVPVGYVFIESKLIWTEEKFDLFDMLVQCIAYFFSFNIKYPDEMSQSLDFIVRYFLNHSPEKFEGPHSNINNMSKINNLIEVLTAT